MFKGEILGKNDPTALIPEAPVEEPLRRPRKPGPRSDGDGAGKPGVKRSSATRKPAAAKVAEDVKPEPAPSAEPAKPAIKRVRKPAAAPDAGTEGKE